MDPREIERVIRAGIPDAQVRVDGDDGRHYQAVIVAAAFEGLGMVKQHQLVYAALGDLMRETIHALSIRTFTPEQFQRAQQSGHL